MAESAGASRTGRCGGSGRAAPWSISMQKGQYHVTHLIWTSFSPPAAWSVAGGVVPPGSAAGFAPAGGAGAIGSRESEPAGGAAGVIPGFDLRFRPQRTGMECGTGSFLRCDSPQAGKLGCGGVCCKAAGAGPESGSGLATAETDAALLRAAGWGVAMGNAPAAVQQAAGSWLLPTPRAVHLGYPASLTLTE